MWAHLQLTEQSDGYTLTPVVRGVSNFFEVMWRPGLKHAARTLNVLINTTLKMYFFMEMFF